jgi:hypothetical protein
VTACEQLLIDLEAKRDIAYMDAKDARVKADTLDYAVIMLKNAIYLDQNGAKDALAKETT